MASSLEKVLPEIEIELGGKTRKLTFGFLALCLLEDKTGKNALNGEAFGNISANTVGTLIWAGLQEQEEIPFKDVLKMMKLQDLQKYSEAIQKAFARSEVSADSLKKIPDAGAVAEVAAG